MTPQTVQPQVHPHLLAELPRFFGGPTQVLRELLQNALRAGASAVTVTQSGEWLTVSDNGCGCADPQLLLTVAQSGWKDVTDPAGMGVLSILNPDLTQSVTFRSRDWTFTLTPDTFTRAEPVPVTPQAYAASGFEVQLRLARPLDVPTLLREARARVPLTVTLNGDVIPLGTLPGPRVSLACGDLILHEATYRDPTRTQAYWEGFPLSANALRQAVMTRLTAPERLFLQAHTLILLPLAESGLRPKLPDRQSLLDNAALQHASDEIAAHVRQCVSQLTGDLDLKRDTITDHEVTRGCNDLHACVRTAWLTQHGYAQDTTLDAQQAVALLGPDNENDELLGVTAVWVQQAGCVLGSSGERHSVQALGLPLRVSTRYEENDAPRVTVDAGAPMLGSAPGTTFLPTVRVVSTLSVNGHKVPWMVTDTALYLQGPPAQAETTLRANLAVIGACLLSEVYDEGDRDEIADWDERPCEVAGQAYGEAALYALVQAHFPARRQAQVDVEAALRAARTAQDAAQALGRVPAHLAPGGTPDFVLRLAALAEHQTTEAARLRAEHRLE